MSAKDLQTILTLLPKLSPAESEQVLQRCRALTVLAPKTEANTNYGWLLDGIQEVLRERGQPSNLSLSVMERTTAFARFKESAVWISDWASKQIPGANRSEKMVLSKILATALAAEIEAFRPISISAMLDSYYRVPGAFERAFPGYAKQGWVRMLLNGGS